MKLIIPLKSLIDKYKINVNGIIHCGAHEGEEAIEYDTNGIRHVVWIEAIPEVFNRLKTNVKKYNHVTINSCVSDVDNEKKIFHVSNNFQSSSLLDFGTHKNVHKEIHFTKDIEVITKKISTIIKENNLDITNYNFLNLDLQGAELMALRGLDEYIHNMDYIYMEVNTNELYIGCPLINEIDSYLGQFGFKRKETVVYQNLGWGDAFYIKE